eukprot:TRINITY_DN14002_c0_g1_i2.p1 TRINITY_DN14002_c0_g1~~TRINITY_DN14002_c0_g1_i2.p1  ORF type:complete len:151 (-),score=10.26 TRINITY_DN14002_c0_g1_i2:246-698(-)
MSEEVALREALITRLGIADTSPESIMLGFINSFQPQHECRRTKRTKQPKRQTSTTHTADTIPVHTGRTFPRAGRDVALSVEGSMVLTGAKPRTRGELALDPRALPRPTAMTAPNMKASQREAVLGNWGSRDVCPRYYATISPTHCSKHFH